MCFMTKCPYVPPHEFNLDFPHLMLRYRAAQLQRGEVARLQRELTETDRNGKLAGLAAPIANWAARTDNEVTRPLLEKIAGVDRAAALPKFHGKTLVLRAMEGKPEVNREAPAFGRKVVLYATCFANYNHPSIGTAALAVLAKNGVETRDRLSRLLRHAAAGARRPCARRRQRAAHQRGARSLDRQGLRRGRAGAVLRADAEVRVAADPAQGCRGQASVRGHLRRRPSTSSTSPSTKVWRPACSPSMAASPCISPVTRARRTWARRRRKCCGSFPPPISR